ncbi:flagellar hook assembly protein FlgD [Massilia sp. IC2-477]|uniref:flagellar hook assembly protein FlgD n=1 Tax=unclassified Massilia TaxID=2609279 RepID=UPI001D0FBC9E|nr:MULTISPECIES: flagellar hook assembly protein FlgD [unclassified Massilia]MCC2957023.1 flagellar hook assembly protein FlgD [Massilia sp. IC2-477]MCC2970832.1 flagellar hook assembly protein FlgD [Massilia sp. IC2-476]
MTTVTNTTGTANINDLMSTMNGKKAEVDGVEADTNKFMTLLVTQLKNQDPLNPLDNAQVTSQLAQLSTVTGVNKLNATLESLKTSYQSAEAMQATNLIGHGVLVEGNKLGLSQGKAILGVELESDADKVEIEITSAKTGKVVATIDLGAQEAGVLPVAWDGVPDPDDLDADGKAKVLPDGTYTYRINATRSGEALTDARALSFDSVASVTTNSKDGVKLNLPVKGVVTMADIKQVL